MHVCAPSSGTCTWTHIKGQGAAGGAPHPARGCPGGSWQPKFSLSWGAAQGDCAGGEADASQHHLSATPRVCISFCRLPGSPHRPGAATFWGGAGAVRARPAAGSLVFCFGPSRRRASCWDPPGAGVSGVLGAGHGGSEGLPLQSSRLQNFCSFGKWSSVGEEGERGERGERRGDRCWRCVCEMGEK